MTFRYKRPDSKNAKSIVEVAKKEMDFTLSLQINEKSASTIIKNIYESFRMLGDALLVAKGKISKEHVEQINELTKINISLPRSLQLLDSYRILRHNLNYYGYIPSLLEVQDIVDFAKKCFSPLVKEVERIMG